jgi:hypothetical protein
MAPGKLRKMVNKTRVKPKSTNVNVDNPVDIEESEFGDKLRNKWKSK